MIPEIQRIWDYIGSAWDSFEDKTLIENYWRALASGIQHVHGHVGNVQFSRTIDLMFPTYNYGPETFNIVYSGLTEELTIDPILEGQEQILNSDFETNTSGWISYGSIPFVRSNTYAHTGTWSLKLPGNNSSCAARYNFGGSQLPSSTASVWIKLESLPAEDRQGSIGLLTIDADGLIIGVSLASVNTTSWQKITLYSQAPNIRGIIVYNMGMVNVYVDDASMIREGLFEYTLPKYTYSIPSITYKYVYNNVTYSGIYLQDVDYLISSELNTLIWINPSIHRDQRFPSKGVLIGTADYVYRINPVLGDVWAKQCGFDIATVFPYYSSFGRNRYDHLKNLIWALDYHQQQAPSIYTLRNAYGIARGLPFSYESGMFSSIYLPPNYLIQTDNYAYVLPTGVFPIPDGYVNQFQVLASGLELYDYFSNPTLINSYTNPYTRRSTLIYDLDVSLSGISFSQDFLGTYMAKIIPEQIQYLTI